MKKLLLALLVLVLGALGAALWWHNNTERDGSTEGSAHLTLYGNVEIRQVSLSFDCSGRIKALHVEEGDRISTGQVLAQLDTEPLALQAVQARAQVALQTQILLRLRNGPRTQELDQAASRLAAALATAAHTAQEWMRLDTISKATDAQGVSEQAVARAQSAMRVAAAQVDECYAAAQLLKEGNRAEDIAAAEAQLTMAEAQLALLEYQIAQGTLLAPVTAVVRSRLLEPGDMASPQRPVFALALTDPKWIRTWVHEPDLDRIHPGMPAQITTDSAPDAPLTGRIGSIASIAEFTPKTVQTDELRTQLVYEVRVLVEDPHEQLRLGQPATVRLFLAEPQSAALQRNTTGNE